MNGVVSKRRSPLLELSVELVFSRSQFDAMRQGSLFDHADTLHALWFWRTLPLRRSQRQILQDWADPDNDHPSIAEASCQ